MIECIRQERAQKNVFFLVVSFAFSVLVTRLYLYLMKYPIIGSGSIHFAHVLFGGILLAIAVLLPLLFANSWVQKVTAIIAGLGLGLFVDEVGKFITANNDYHFRPAAPIIYSIFLLFFFLYVFMKRKREHSTKEHFYHVLDNCKEILEYDLDQDEKEDIRETLALIQEQEKDPVVKKFAKSLQIFIESIHEQKKKALSPWTTQWLSLKQIVRSWCRVHKTLLYLLLILLTFKSILAIVAIGELWSIISSQGGNREILLKTIFSGAVVTQDADISLLIIQTITQAGIALAIIFGVVMRLFKKERGITIVKFALIFSICTVDVIAFYFNQFYQTIPVMVDLIIIGYIGFFQNLYRKES